MKFRSALAAATMLALPIAATAQPVTGIYLGGEAGINLMQDEGAQITSGRASGGGWLSGRAGPAFLMNLGYGLGNGLRAEVEGNFRYNNFYSSNSNTAISGAEQKYGGMFNVLYDFVGMVPVVQPYIGAGVGYQWAQARSISFSPVFARTSASALSDTSTQGSFAYQAILGGSIPIPSVPGLAVTADYRFMGLEGNRNYGGTVSAVTATRSASASANFKLSNNFNHAFMIGVRYNFGQEGPPPAPVPAAVPASPVSRSYLVFFDWDKAVLTDRARQIVSEAAANSTKVQYTRIEVNGYTDTSGTPKYNMGLSIRRAKAVAAELVKDGVPKDAISIQGFGDTHLLVPTGPGVREPQNRRVEIIIR
jgi:OOP family OmpA-OmpF porin